MERGFVSLRKDDVRRAHSPPTSVDGEEKLWGVSDKWKLGFGREHKVAIAFVGHGKRGEDAAANAKVCGAHVCGFFRLRKAEGDTAEVRDGHGIISSRACSRCMRT